MCMNSRLYLVIFRFSVLILFYTQAEGLHPCILILSLLNHDFALPKMVKEGTYVKHTKKRFCGPKRTLTYHYPILFDITLIAPLK